MFLVVLDNLAQEFNLVSLGGIISADYIMNLRRGSGKLCDAVKSQQCR